MGKHAPHSNLYIAGRDPKAPKTKMEPSDEVRRAWREGIESALDAAATMFGFKLVLDNEGLLDASEHIPYPVRIGSAIYGMREGRPMAQSAQFRPEYARYDIYATLRLSGVTADTTDVQLRLYARDEGNPNFIRLLGSEGCPQIFAESHMAFVLGRVPLGDRDARTLRPWIGERADRACACASHGEGSAGIHGAGVPICSYGMKDLPMDDGQGTGEGDGASSERRNLGSWAEGYTASRLRDCILGAQERYGFELDFRDGFDDLIGKARETGGESVIPLGLAVFDAEVGRAIGCMTTHIHAWVDIDTETLHSRVIRCALCLDADGAEPIEGSDVFARAAEAQSERMDRMAGRPHITQKQFEGKVRQGISDFERWFGVRLEPSQRLEGMLSSPAPYRLLHIGDVTLPGEYEHQDAGSAQDKVPILCTIDGYGIDAEGEPYLHMSMHAREEVPVPAFCSKAIRRAHMLACCRDREAMAAGGGNGECGCEDGGCEDGGCHRAAGRSRCRRGPRP